METTIAICDDDRLHSDALEQLLVSYAQKTGCAFRILKFSDGRSLLENGAGAHILFLDAHMPGLDGLETAWRMRRQNPDFLLIFVSAHMEYAPMGYEVRAFRYLLKSQLPHTLERCLDAALQALGVTRAGVWLPFVGGGRTVYVDEIVFAESQKHVVHFHLAARAPLHLYDKLDRVAAQLPAGQFLRIHKSYLVGLRHLDSVRGYTAYLRDGRALPVSQKKYAGVKREVSRYKGMT